jgi:hypothetical protein
VGLTDLRIRDNGGNALSLTGASVNYDAASHVATWLVAALDLPDGRYSATLLSAGLTDPAGNPLGGGTDYALSFARLHGDGTGDGVVDQADYTLWYNRYGVQGTAYTTGDYNGDGIVDQADYTLWYNHYGATIPSAPKGAESLIVLDSPTATEANSAASSPDVAPMLADSGTTSSGLMRLALPEAGTPDESRTSVLDAAAEAVASTTTASPAPATASVLSPAAAAVDSVDLLSGPTPGGTSPVGIDLTTSPASLDADVLDVLSTMQLK